MAITTAQQRFTLMSMGVTPWLIPAVVFPPQGSVTTSDRAAFLGLISFATATTTTNNLVDAVYNITKRYVNGTWVYYTERYDDRIWPTVEHAWCLDAALAYPLYAPQGTLFFDNNANVAGATSTMTSDASIWASYHVGNIIRAYAGIATITAFVNSEEVTVTINQPFCGTVQSESGQAPLPAAANQWTQGVPATTLHGLDHLEGLSVVALADGAVIDGLTVTGGSITLPNEATMIVVGLPFVVQLQSLPIEPSGGQGTAQGKRKNIPAVTVRVDQSRGFEIGTNQFDFAQYPAGTTLQWGSGLLPTGSQQLQLVPIKDRSAQVDAGNAVPLYTGDYRLQVPGNWVKPGQIAVQQVNPLPLSVLAFIPELIGGDNDDGR